MPKLQCGVSNCAHNSDSLCSLNQIEVDGALANCDEGTCCSNFVEAIGATNFAGEASPLTDVGCKASNCTFNCSGKCGAASISIEGFGASNTTGTECSSFTCK